MHLRDWLIAENISFAAFAAQMTAHLERNGVNDRAVSGETVRRYCLPETHPDHRKPRAGHMRAIYALTRRAVSANDFYGLSESEAAPGNGATPRAGAACDADDGASPLAAAAPALPPQVAERVWRRTVRKQARAKAWAKRKARRQR